MSDIFKILEKHFDSLPKIRLNDFDSWDEIPLGMKFGVEGLKSYPNPVVKTKDGFITHEGQIYFSGVDKPSDIDDGWIIIYD